MPRINMCLRCKNQKRREKARREERHKGWTYILPHLVQQALAFPEVVQHFLEQCPILLFDEGLAEGDLRHIAAACTKREKVAADGSFARSTI